MLGRPAHVHAATALEVEQAFVSKEPERAQHCVGVDAELGGEVFGRREAVAGRGLTLSDGAADLRCDLGVQLGGLVAIYLDVEQWC